MAVLRIGKPATGQISRVEENLNVRVNNQHPWTIGYTFRVQERDYQGSVNTLNPPGPDLRAGRAARVLYLLEALVHNSLYPHPQWPGWVSDWGSRAIYGLAPPSRSTQQGPLCTPLSLAASREAAAVEHCRGHKRGAVVAAAVAAIAAAAAVAAVAAVAVFLEILFFSCWAGRGGGGHGGSR